MSEWIEEPNRSYRWIQSFAWLPKRTMDHGWIWLVAYFRYQQSWGWGFFDDYAYLERTNK